MKSCLYNCEIYHDRRRPKVHAFNYRVFMFCIDLDEAHLLDRNPLIGHWPGTIYSLRATDHLQSGASSIRENLIRYLRSQGYTGTIGSIRLVTHLRTLGYIFNPVSFYFIDDAEGHPACILAEVANTFNEQKLYILGPDTLSHGRFRDQQVKEFYISPFSAAGTKLHFSMRFPDDRLQIAIDQSDEEGIFFRSGMKGQRIPLTPRNLLLQTLRYPWITLQGIVAIHVHALILVLKKVPFYRKEAQPDLQKNIRTYLNARPMRVPDPLV